MCRSAVIASRSAVCEDVESYLNLPSDLGGDMTIEVPADVVEIACATPESLEINGGTLTLTSTNTVRLVARSAQQ